MTVLLLGGTAEGRELADRLADLGVPTVSSLAGRVSAPRLPRGEVRIGGFGGADGLRDYLTAHAVTAVVDATHPFAARITAHAVAACRSAGTPLVVLRRPAWTPGPGDSWHPARDIADAARRIGDLTPPDGRVLLTTGRQDVAAFAALPQRFWLRAVEPPTGAVPKRCDVILDRGPFALDDELRLLRELRVDLLVTKNSGGQLTAPKLTAARELGVPVLMVRRPPLPDGVTPVPTVDEAVARLRL